VVKYAVRWTDAASNDLQDIHDYLLTVTSQATAKRLTLEIEESTWLLPEHPRLYQVFPSAIEDTRHIVVHSTWRVLYVVDDAAHCCTVVAVVHGSRLA